MMLRYRTLWLVLSWLWLAIIIILSLITLPKTAEISIPYFDKVEHTFSYFVLMFLFSQCYLLSKIRVRYAMSFIVVGIVLEILQSFTVARQFEYADMLANTTGIVLGLLFSNSILQKVIIFIDHKILSYIFDK